MLQPLLRLLEIQPDKTAVFSTESQLFQAKPYEVVVQPWRGRHHVYGIFMLPNQHQLKSPVFLTIKGAGTFPRLGYVFADNVERYPVKPDHYFLRVHLKTRVALLIILQGLGSQLIQPGNWTMTYTLSPDDKFGDRNRSHVS